MNTSADARKTNPIKPNQTQPVVSLPAMSVAELVEPISKAKNAAEFDD